MLAVAFLVFLMSMKLNCVKSVRIRSFSGPHFPAFGLNTERYGVYGVSLRIQSKFGKMRTRKTPKTGTFHEVLFSLIKAALYVLPIRDFPLATPATLFLKDEQFHYQTVEAVTLFRVLIPPN